MGRTVALMHSRYGRRRRSRNPFAAACLALFLLLMLGAWLGFGAVVVLGVIFGLGWAMVRSERARLDRQS